MKPRQEPEEGRHPQVKAVWERPSRRLLGSVKDLVKGVTKSGPNADSDPNNTKKLGVG